MSRAASGGFILLFRRSYTVAAADNTKVKGQAVASTIRNMVDSDIINVGKVAKGLKKEVFWMRDPKTGNWLPETHFDQVDVAELRAKIFSNNH